MLERYGARSLKALTTDRRTTSEPTRSEPKATAGSPQKSAMYSALEMRRTSFFVFGDDTTLGLFRTFAMRTQISQLPCVLRRSDRVTNPVLSVLAGTQLEFLQFWKLRVPWTWALRPVYSLIPAFEALKQANVMFVQIARRAYGNRCPAMRTLEACKFIRQRLHLFYQGSDPFFQPPHESIRPNQLSQDRSPVERGSTAPWFAMSHLSVRGALQ